MANVIRVTPEELENVANQLEGWTDSYNSCYNQILSTASDLSSSWAGEAQQAYLTQINGFEDDFKNLYVLFNQYASFLRTSAKKYSETEATIRDSAKALSTGL
ncbi:MAG: WXG100 family type VII secretion target [Clostridiales bacterium]|nr:WXG100 family type VII secretion target [Clostridiales bacterium]MCD8214800.1 WXG100 family type VII secretion target [Clostridiales bacterium]